MRTSNSFSFGAMLRVGACGLALLAGINSLWASEPAPTFKSAASALQEGQAAIKRGDGVAAIEALEYAAAQNDFMAQYELARFYADNSTAETDHAKAYMLYQTIADENSDADPDDAKRAPYIAKALTALAGYLRVGIPEIGLQPDLDRAADYLHHAALFFGDEDAQFELVKMKLKGDGVPEDIASAKHWLAVLTQRGHAGAQAFLADLYWRGKLMEQDKVRAFALITVAVEHAPAQERIWIEDVYQNIFCGAGEGIRKQATGMVAEWRTRYGRKVEESRSLGLDPLYPMATRTCSNGDKVMPIRTPVVPSERATPLPPKVTARETLVDTQSISASTTVTTATSLRDVSPQSSAGLPTPGLSQGFLPTTGSLR